MYPVAIVGSGLIQEATYRAMGRSGFEDINLYYRSDCSRLPATTLTANLTRILKALEFTELNEYGHQPDRAQTRLARSGYLLAEIPLGRFMEDRYGSPVINIELSQMAAVTEVRSAPPLTELEKSHNAVLIATPEQGGEIQRCYHAAIERRNPEANITWLGRSFCAFQFSTPERTHFLFCVSSEDSLDPGAWHPHLAEPLNAAVAIDLPSFHEPIPQWHEGHIAYLGDAAYRVSPVIPEATYLGLEDIWVLSRMMENYEEDVASALSEYEKYRRPRARRVVNLSEVLENQYMKATPVQSLFNHINTAFSTRFLPEIRMQKLDWMYAYDCIKGFH